MSDGIDFQPAEASGGNDIDFQSLPGPEPNDVGHTPPAEAMQQDMYGPGLQDATVGDAMNVQGIAGLGKMGAGLAAKGVGSVLNAIPATENLLPTIERVANNQTLKSFGGSMQQLKQMSAGRGGREALDRGAEYARDKGLADVLSTSIGREKRLEALKNYSGETIGALRDEAGPAPSNIIDQIVKNPKIDPYLGKGSASRELGSVDTALNDIKEIGGDNPTHASLADAATAINKDAAGTKMYQPVNAQTDVANILSDINNQGIAQSLGSTKAKQYLEALGEQQNLHPLEHLQARGELRQTGARGGLERIPQEIADRFGYRSAAKNMAALHDMLTGEHLAQNAANIPKNLAKAGAGGGLDAITQKIHDYLIKERQEE